MTALGGQEAEAISVDTNAVDRAGVSLSEFRITTELQYIFREQPTSDYGVDAHVEIKRDGRPNGRLLGLQIKSGRSRFGQETADGWKFRPKKKHIKYWLGHSLPLYVLLVDVDARTIYWQELSEATLERGPRGGIYVTVPRGQTLATARDPWERAAERFVQSAGLAYVDNLAHLPPKTAADIAQIASRDQQAAALLAAHLAFGRGSPELAVRTLLDSAPAWLLEGEPGNGFAVLADYAHAHGLEPIAVEALLKAADLSPAKRYRYTRNGGLILLDSDRAQARALLDAAAAMEEANGDLRLVVGYAILEHPIGSANPVAITTEDEAKLRASEQDDLILTFLARRAECSGDLDTAVELGEKALALDDKSAGLMTMVAEVLMRRAHSPNAQSGDQTRGIRLATQAIDQLHDWAGPTEQALDILLRSMMPAGQFREALDRALSAPDGGALPQEAIRPSVQAIAALAAAALGHPERSAKIIDSMAPGLDRDIAKLRTTGPDDGEAGDQASWLELLDRLDESRPEALLQAVLRLADLDVDKTERLNVMVERGIIPASIRAVAAAVAAAAVNLDDGLPALRVLAESHELAAAKLVNLLGEADRVEDAQSAAGVAYTRFRNVEFAVQRARMLRYLDRGTEATNVATQALSDSTLDPRNRRIANGVLARSALDEAANADPSTRTQCWQRAERHLLECVATDDGSAADPGDVWQLADVQLRLGAADQAFNTLTRHDPSIATADQAGLWLSIVQRQPSIPNNLYPRMLDLADQFSGDAQLSGALLGTVIGRTRNEDDEPATPADTRPTLPGELRAAAFASLHAHVERFGDSSPFRVLQAPTTEELIVQMTELMRRDTQPLVELLEMVRQGRLPLGLLATASQRPYASTIALRPLGYLLATSSIEEDANQDEETARQAADRDVVVDSSVLAVASQLDEYEKLRGKYRSLLMPTVARDDITRSRRDLDGRSASSGFVTYDSVSDSIVASEVDLEEHLAALERFAAMERAATSLQLVGEVDMTPVKGVAIPGSEPWLAPIALSLERGVPLWSDDLAQRRLARHVGVESFGTTAAQQARADDKLDDESLSTDELTNAFEARRREALDQLTHRIADAPVDVETVIEQARAEAWDQGVALVTIGRPGWWHMAPNPWADLRTVFDEAHTAGVAVDQWRYHAMWGAVRLTTDEPSRAATLLASVALLPVAGEGDDSLVQHFRAADAIATQYQAHKPADFLAEAATMLANAGLIEDPAETAARARARLQAEMATSTQPVT